MLHVIVTYAKRKSSVVVALSFLLAFLYTILAATQLMSFEKLPGILMVLWPVGVAENAKIGAALLVVAEVFSLPFLLGMQLSYAMRIISALLSYVVVLYIVYIGYYSAARAVEPFNTGLAGTYVTLPGGSWLLWFGMGLLTLLIWYTIRSIMDEGGTYYRSKAHTT